MCLPAYGVLGSYGGIYPVNKAVCLDSNTVSYSRQGGKGRGGFQGCSAFLKATEFSAQGDLFDAKEDTC